MGKALVIFDVMRHGEKDGDKLTPKGKEQVAVSARANLTGRNYVLVLHSEMQRARETVHEVLQTIGIDPSSIDIMVEEGFGYEWAIDPRWPAKEVQRIKASGEATTVDFWIEKWPSACMLRGRVMATLLFWAQMIVEDEDAGEEEVHVLVGSHSPCGDMAAIDPKTTDALGEADIMRYTVEVDLKTLEAKIVSSKVLRAPK